MNKEEIQFIVDVIREASQKVIEIYNTYNIDYKSKYDNSPLTIADITSHNIITNALQKFNIQIISEEGKKFDYVERSKWNQYWLLDPLDGTKEFINRNGEFTINLALVQNNIPIWGIVSLPFFNKIYYINEKNNVILNIKNKKYILKPKDKRELNKLKPKLKFAISKSHSDIETINYINKFIDPIIIKAGSALKFMLIAENKADVYVRMGDTYEWDTAASYAILSALNHGIYNIEDEQIVKYNTESLLHHGFISY
jgi:3'(2'), 5'-bisphosphate nucleotidase